MPPRSWSSTTVPARCLALAFALLAWLAATVGCGGGPGGAGPSTEPAAAEDSASRWLAALETSTGEANRLKVFLFYQSSAGDLLLPVEREIFRTDKLVDQAKQVIELLARAPEGGEEAVSALPPGARLRSLFLFEDSLAVADFSREMSLAHPGGVWGEVASIYSVVDSLTFNFPSIRRVKILVGGREAETLAGHVSLARPFGMDLSMVGTPRTAADQAGSEAPPAVPPAEIVSPPGDGGE